MPGKSITISLLILLACAALSQTPAPLDAARGLVRLRVRVGRGNKAKGLARKRFFLVKGSLEENKTLIDHIERQPVISRDCYYRSKGASEGLIAWLKENDCESVYCREVDPKNIDGPEAVPEFQRAAAIGEKEFGSRELGRKWITVNLANDFRDGFYKLKQKTLLALLTEAESSSHQKVASVMTDRNGTAYFTDIEPGPYVITSMLPVEFGGLSSVWNCAVAVKPAEAIEKPFLISNPGNKDPRDIRNIRCYSVEKPLPVCDVPAR